MRLKSGSPAMTFDAEDVNGKLFSLREQRGSKIHLSFFRNAACALCGLRYFKLRDMSAEWSKQGLVMVSVFESPREVLLKNLAGQSIPYTLVADENHILYTLYGLEKSWSRTMVSMLFPSTYVQARDAYRLGLAHDGAMRQGGRDDRMPAEFLIDEDGVIHRAFYSSYVGNFMPLFEIEEFLAAEKA